MNKYMLIRKKIISTYLIYSLIILMFSSTLLPLFGIFTNDALLTIKYAFIASAILSNIIILITRTVINIQIDAIFASTLIFLIYLLINTALSSHHSNNITFLMIISFAILLCSFKMLPTDCSNQINNIILLVCFIESCYGITQYLINYIDYIALPCSGTFDNPTGFAAFLSISFPFCLYRSDQSKPMKFFGYIVFTTIIISIALSQSRSGIIAITLVLLLYIAQKYYNKTKRKYNIVFAITTILIALFIILVFVKKDSSIGRLFVWERTIEMVENNPLFGNGPDSFIANYMTYQSDYFKNNLNPEYAYLADNVTHPFSEFLLLTTEFGIIGLILLLLPALFVIKNFNRITPYHLSLLSVIIFAAFSYPLRYPSVLIILSYCLANICCKNKVIFNSKKLITGAFSLLSCFLIILLIKHFSFEYQWRNSYINIQTNNFTNQQKQILQEYEMLHSRWNGNPIFLYNYGAILHEIKNYSKSNSMMIESIKYFNNYDAHLIIGMNFEMLNQYKKAEEHYTVAKYMCPNRFIPLYRLMNLYSETGQNIKAKQIANEILLKKVKVESLTVSSIKQKAKNLLKSE